MVCDEGAGYQDILMGTQEEEEAVDLKDALFTDPIVGTEQILKDEHGPGALQPRPLPTPPTFTPAQWARHCLTHLPFHSGCPICVACRRPNTHHRQTREAERVIPLLVADYCYVRSTGESELQTVLVMRLYPYKVFFASVTPQKGVFMPMVHRIAQFLKDTGLIQFAYRCDREKAINSMLEAAILESARKGVRVKADDLMMPEDFPGFEIAQEDEDEPPVVESTVADTPAGSSHSSGPLVATPELTHPGEPLQRAR